MITPTVGRVLWFYPDGSRANEKPRAAIVTAVWGDRCVNLSVFEQNGVPMSHPPTSVRLLQDDDQPPTKEGDTLMCHCRWMPFQIGQAQKAEQLQAQLAAANVQPGTGG